ncbi:hypothetical protein VU04_05525 [Desulfobulbus sp. TB]|nr:hypothetical protein [Desulfobulbus sp. TB]
MKKIIYISFLVSIFFCNSAYSFSFKNTPFDLDTHTSTVHEYVGKPVKGVIKATKKKTHNRFYVYNTCPRKLDVKIRYNVRSNIWNTKKYTFLFNEKAYLVPTKNRYISISAKSKDGEKTWKEKKINMGSKFVDYTYTLSCGR